MPLHFSALLLPLGHLFQRQHRGEAEQVSFFYPGTLKGCWKSQQPRTQCHSSSVSENQVLFATSAGG